MNLNIALCDDNEKDRAELGRLITTYAFDRNQDFHIEEFRSGRDLLAGFRREHPFHVVFLDIEMPGEDGISIADRIRQLSGRKSILVFVSSYPEYMQESFRVHPYHFLAKPVKSEDIDTLMSDLLSDLTDSRSLLTVIDGYDREYMIRPDDLCFIETADAKNKELYFHLSDQVISAKGTLTDWRDKLKDHAFHAASRTVLVNLAHIRYINDLTIVLDNGQAVAVSRRNRKELLGQYLNQVVTLQRRHLLP